ncbi:MAG: tetratricopeptide repeat protein [Desulfobulbaceae bacterium]|nr:tetratricopeptide repeat protein [Desulfobulbaceae bacterium]
MSNSTPSDQPVCLTSDEALQQAIAHHQANRLQDAERFYRAILKVYPNHPDANHNLGVLAVQMRHVAEGLVHFKVALEVNPSQAQYWLSYIDTLISADQPQAAMEMLKAAKQRGFVADQFKALEARLDILRDPARHIVQPRGDEPSAHEVEALLEMYHTGRYVEAENAARALIAGYVNNGIGWKVLGPVLQAQGRHDEARATMQKATQLFPEDAGVHYNMGHVLDDQGLLHEAELSYRRALALNPGFALAHNNLGNTLAGLGRLPEAEACYRRALELNPDYAKACNNLGNLLKDRGLFSEAEANYHRALQIKPNFVEALNNLARLHAIKGKPEVSLSILSKSLLIEERYEAQTLFVGCIRQLRFERIDASLRDTLVRAFSVPWGRPCDMAKVGADIVKLNRDVGECIARAACAWPSRLSVKELLGPAGISPIVSDRLLHCLLISAPICSIELERFLTMMRMIMLDDVISSGGTLSKEAYVIDFCCALANQCFINEYVFVTDKAEIDKVKYLQSLIADFLDTGARIPAILPVVVATYIPLSSLPFSVKLLERQWPEAVMSVMIQQVKEPEVERSLRETICQLTSIEDEVSVKVRNQYEENPYPRWVKVAPFSRPMGIDARLRRLFPDVTFKPLEKTENIDVLIAGCGTGQHPIDTARHLLGARMLAVDLSLNSLCYAKRKTMDFDLKNIEYAQADIMKLGELGREFDVIESAGVLHHLADPFAGWRVLLSLLRPGGFMYLGFYSEIARRDVVNARHYVAERERGDLSEVDAIRQGRQDMIDADKSFGKLLETGDFFSVSACRDLLFHAQEHRMTLVGIDNFLKVNGLLFLGFEIDDNILHDYKLRFPDDPTATNLRYWNDFENENPDIFFGMYQFWIQKAG